MRNIVNAHNIVNARYQIKHTSFDDIFGNIRIHKISETLMVIADPTNDLFMRDVSAFNGHIKCLASNKNSIFNSREEANAIMYGRNAAVIGRTYS